MSDTESPAASATAAGPRVDVQDPLPENDWFWRRTFTFVMSIISLAFIWFGVEALYNLQRGEEIYRITRYMIGINAMLILFYMVAPSAEQIVKLIQAAKLLREGVPMSRSAVVETRDARTAVSTAAGTPAAPVAPPAAPTGAGEVDAAPRSRT